MVTGSVVAATLSLLFAAQSEPSGTTPPPTRPAVDPEVIELRARVAHLEDKVGELQAKSDEEWLSERRASEIRSVVQDVLADADVRASLSDSGATSGWDKGFFLRSADGNYLLRIGGQLQFRFVWNHQNNSPTDDDRYDFEVRRAKLFFTGHIVDPSWQYQFELDASRVNGTTTLGESAWIMKDLGEGFKIKAGQFKPMYLREESVSSRRLQAVERSLVNSQFTAGTAQGVQVSYETERWRVFAAFIDGFGSANTAFPTENNEYAATSRIELLAFGDWKSIEDDSSFRGTDPALLFGGGASYQQQEFGTGTNAPPPNFNNSELEDFGLNADVTWKAGGFSIAGSLIYRRLSTGGGALVPLGQDQVGAVLRGGVFVLDDVELYTSYEWGNLDIAGISELSTLTVGVTKFWDKHNLKWQTDFGYGFNPVAPQWAQTSAGWRADAPNQDGQIVIRSQFQFLF